MKNYALIAFAVCLIATAPLYYAFQAQADDHASGPIPVSIEPAAN